MHTFTLCPFLFWTRGLFLLLRLKEEKEMESNWSFGLSGKEEEVCTPNTLKWVYQEPQSEKGNIYQEFMEEHTAAECWLIFSMLSSVLAIKKTAF